MSIEAIYPCRVSFNQDSTCSFQNCYTESPGNPQNQTDWNVCFTSCCPGFVIPSSSVRDSLLRCYDQYLSIPSVFKIKHSWCLQLEESSLQSPFLFALSFPAASSISVAKQFGVPSLQGEEKLLQIKLAER